MQKGRTIRFALLFCVGLSSTAGAETLVWRSVGLRQNVILCAALFKVRSDWMVEFKMDPTASAREFDAAFELQTIYGQHVHALNGWPKFPPDEDRPPLIRGPLTRGPTDLGPEVGRAKEKLLTMFTESGDMKHRPPVCLEDETCASCWDLLRLMQTQD